MLGSVIFVPGRHMPVNVEDHVTPKGFRSVQDESGSRDEAILLTFG